MDKKNIHDKFEEISRRFPDKIALLEDDRSITYQELNSYANRVAHALSQLGVGEDDLVGIYLDASIEYIFAMLGILKAGAIFIPLNTKFPEKRMKSIIDKVKPKFFITHTIIEVEFCEIYKKLAIADLADHVLIIDNQFNFNVKVLPDGNSLTGMQNFQSDDLTLEVSPDNGCYIMTTSGSTGEPKAILGSHKGLNHFIDWEINEFEFNDQIRVSLLSHITFDVSLRDMFVPLTTGGTLCIPEEGTRQNPRKLFRWLKDKEITLTHIVPTLFRMLTHEIADSGRDSDPLPKLKYLLIAGEPLYGDDILRWRQLNGTQAELVNIYGPTETTLAKFFYRISDENIAVNEMIPVGKPIPDTEVFIIKDNRQCGIGETGEVYIKTPFCSKGYYNDPALTEASFIQNPLDSNAVNPVYKTGDLGEFIKKDTLRLVGRVDDQIKLYGNRVEINEIEVALRKHPDVRQAAVAPQKDAFGNLRLIGYTAPKNEDIPTVESLRRFLGKRLPDYMVPSMFVTLAELPMTHNQKINRRALPKPDRSRPIMEQEFVSPSSALEKNLSKIWSKVLDLDHVGIHDNFFDIGGTSVLSMHISTLINEMIGVELPVVKLFQYPTISSIAKYLTEQQIEQPSYEKAVNRAQRRKAALARQRRSRTGQ